LITQQLEQRLSAEGSSHAPRATKIAALAARAVEWTHDLTRSLSPPALDTAGLPEALNELASNAQNIFGIECSFETMSPSIHCDIAAAVHLYRIAQEAISNAVKHGQARLVEVKLREVDGEVQMQIIDDGAGIKTLSDSTDGMGLRIMRYRANMIGAQLSVQQRAAREQQAGGTVITCRYRPPQR
jgi:signal transduction histidine kinase